MDQKPTIDTASLFASETFGQEGFHLVCFEVMNWGTFTSNIPYSFQFKKGESAILVGDNGSGKTTLIDAFLTLFVDNPTYNATSDTKKKGDDRRTLRTYFWGREDSDKDGRKKNLREAPSYSVILAQFTNHTGQTYTFARLLWMNSEADPKVNTLYVIANATLRIQKDFYMDAKGINGLIRRLRMNGAIKTFDRYYEYIAEVRGNLHIPDDNALHLFNKIVSLKGIEDTDTFIRDNMLTEPQNDRCLNDIIRNADALEDISKAIQTDEARIVALTPIAEKTAEYDANEEKKKEIERQKEQARQWIYKTGIEDAKRLVQEKTRSKKENQEKEGHLLDAIAEIRKRINEINSLEYKEAGQQIEQLKAQLEGDTRTHKDRYRKFLSYQQHCQRLSMEVPLTQKAFGPIPKALEKKDKELKDTNETILNQLIEENMKKQASDTELRSLQDTIRSMKTTNSNIDDRLTSIRDRLADSLHIPYQEDAIILNYKQLEKIPLSRKGKMDMLNRAIERDERVRVNLLHTDRPYTVSGYEKEIESLEKAKGELPVDDPELQGLCFDDLGIDRLYVDEAQYYKNLTTKTKMGDLVGVSTKGAGKTDDLYEKCQYLNNKTHHQGVIFATGTPISNSVTELYTLQRYLQDDVLRKLGVAHFDAWASTFGQQKAQLDLGQDGKSLKQRMHFSAFNNVPELLSTFYQVADVRTADMLQLDTPEEKLHYVTTKPSALQKEGIKVLGERAQAIYDGNPWTRTSRVDGTQYPDNMLSITTDGRLLALDPRLLDPKADDNPNSKVNQCVKNAVRIFKETKKEKGTQLIFCDTGTPDKDKKNAKDFCLYEDIREKLIKAGVPKKEIAFVHDATNDKKKLELFEKVREGKVRILLGSTGKLGVGTNVQDRVTAIHDLDVPWRPSDLAQRKGRGVRQGNLNDSVDIYRYITQNTFDAYLWQINENKQRFLSQVMTSRTPSRTIEDVDSAVLTCAEAKALAVGDSKLKDAMVLQNEIMRLSLERDAYLSQQDRMAEDLASYYPEAFEHLKTAKKNLETDYKALQHSKNKTITILDKSFPEESFPYLLKKMQERIEGRTITGTYRNIPIACHKDEDGTLQVKFQFKEPRVLSIPPLATQRVIKNRIKKLPQDILDAIAQSEIQRADLKKMQERDEKLCGKPFPKEDQYLEKRTKLQRYDSLLQAKKPSKEEEEEKRTNLILSPQDGTFTPCERYFLAYARSYMEQTGGEWDDQADALAVKALEKKHFHPSRIFDAIEKFSPAVPSIQELQKAFQQSKLSRA